MTLKISDSSILTVILNARQEISDIREDFDNKNEDAAVYGNVNLSKEAKSAVTLISTVNESLVGLTAIR